MSQTLAAKALRPDYARKRATWAELLERVFEIDVLTCPWCSGKRKLIALITAGSVVRRILAHLGLPTAECASGRVDGPLTSEEREAPSSGTSNPRNAKTAPVQR